MSECPNSPKCSHENTAIAAKQRMLHMRETAEALARLVDGLLCGKVTAAEGQKRMARIREEYAQAQGGMQL